MPVQKPKTKLTDEEKKKLKNYYKLRKKHDAFARELFELQKRAKALKNKIDKVNNQLDIKETLEKISSL